jgi:hypothetical protein
MNSLQFDWSKNSLMTDSELIAQTATLEQKPLTGGA